MAYDAHKNFGYSTVLSGGVVGSSSGTTLTVQSGDGTKFAANMNITVWPAGVNPTTTNAEIMRVTNVLLDTLTVTRAQENSSVLSGITVGYQVADTITAKELTDIEVPGTNAAAALVLTGETSTSTTYADLTTTTDSVTVTVGANGLALVAIFSYIANNTSNAITYVSFDVSGANTIVANDNTALLLQVYAGGAQGQLGATFLLTSLTAGSTTFKMKYRVQTGGSGAGTGTFQFRRIAVIPY